MSDNYQDQMAAEVARLRAVNAKLVEACEAAVNLMEYLKNVNRNPSWLGVDDTIRAALAAAKEESNANQTG